MRQLADLEETARKGPEACARVVGALLQEDLAVVLDDDGDDDAGVQVMDEAAVFTLQASPSLRLDVALDEEVAADLAVAGR
jgi:hypothetical protein